jgi:chaperonin cofactor prefoldin
MLAVAFDTLKLARKLESAGMQSKQAQDTSAALSETYTEWLALGNVATREDVHEVRAELHEVKAELRADIAKLEVKIGSLETKIEATKAEILRWMFGQTIVLLGSLFALIHYH